MEHLPNLGTSIPDTLLPTVKAYSPLLLAKKDAILATPRSTHTYGSHSRQLLDVYAPRPDSTSTTKPPPILIFFYGGGFERGDRVLPAPWPDNLVYTNIGHFFSQKLGFVTLIPDYRRKSEGAQFPSGGEDVAATIEWVKANYPGKQDIFLMGHSAGGVHVSTFILHPQFGDIRRSIITATDGGLHLTGVILLAAPFDFRSSHSGRADTLKSYFGERMAEDCPLGLLKGFAFHASKHVQKPRFYVLRASLDPEDEIIQPTSRFVKAWKEKEHHAAMDENVLEGHNHLSPCFSLGTDLAKEEEWGFMVGKWINDVVTAYRK